MRSSISCGEDFALNEIARQVVTILFGRGILRVAQFITFVVLARTLTPGDFGWFGIVTTAITLASLAGSLGLRASFGYEVGQKHRTSGEVIGTSITVWIPLAVVATYVVYILYGDQLPSVDGAQAGAIIGTGVAAGLLVILMQSVYLGRGDIRDFALTETAPRAIQTVLIVGVALISGLTLQSSLWAYSAGFAITVPIALYLAMKGASRPTVNFVGMPRTLRFGIVYAANILLTTLCARISMFVIEHYDGADSAGQFYAAVRVYEIFLEMATAVGMVLFSNAARREEGAASILQRNARIACWMFWSFLVLGGVVAMTAPYVVEVLAGANYQSAAPALQILALSLAPTAATKAIYPTLSGSGRPHFGTPIILASLVVNSAIAVSLVPAIGLVGGAYAIVAGQYLLFVGYVASCRIRFTIPLSDLLIPRPSDAARMYQAVKTHQRRR